MRYNQACYPIYATYIIKFDCYIVTHFDDVFLVWYVLIENKPKYTLLNDFGVTLLVPIATKNSLKMKF